jgi:hypothetical protein
MKILLGERFPLAEANERRPPSRYPSERGRSATPRYRLGGAARIYAFSPGGVFSSGKRLVSRAHRAASSSCNNLFLTTPHPLPSAKKVGARQALSPRNLMRREAFAGAFPPSAGGLVLRGREQETTHDRNK